MVGPPGGVSDFGKGSQSGGVIVVSPGAQHGKCCLIIRGVQELPEGDT